MRILYRASILSVIMLVIAACGNVAAPQYEADRIVAEAQAEATHIIETAQAGGEADSQAVVEEPTDVPPTEIPPTEAPTEVPPTEVPTEAPTEIPPTEVPPTEVPTEAPADDTDAGDAGAEGIEAEIMAAVEAADPAAGQTTFQTIGCAGCHMTTDMQMVGPGLAGLYNRAGDRVEGQGPYEYIFTSIRNSQEFIVEGYPAGVMIQYTEAMLSDEDIYNVMAWLKEFSN